MALVTIPVESGTVFKIRQALWPSALAQSFWSFTKVIVSDDVKRLAGMLGFQLGDPPLTIEDLLSKQRQLMKGPPPTKERPATSKQPQLLGDTQTQKSIVPITAQEEVDADTKRAAHAIFGHFSRGVLAFRTKLQQTWQYAPGYPPRGSIFVDGLVELEAPKAWLVFDVKGAWDPKTNTFDSKSLVVHLKTLQMKKQGPLGGL
jgi:hypothetical protein